MNDVNLPNHILNRVERRWASRLARDAAAWRHEKGGSSMQTEIKDRAGRLVPVTRIRQEPAARSVLERA